MSELRADIRWVWKTSPFLFFSLAVLTVSWVSKPLILGAAQNVGARGSNPHRSIRVDTANQSWHAHHTNEGDSQMKHDPYPRRYKRFTEITGEKHLGYPNRYLVIYPGIQGDMWETVSYRNDAQEAVDHHGGRFVDLDASLRPGTIAELAPHPGEEYPVVVEIVSYIVNGYVLVRTKDQSPRLAWMVEPHRLTPIQEAAA